MTPEECAKPCDLKERTREKYDVQWKHQDDDAAAGRRKSLSMVADPLIRMVQPLKGMIVADLGMGTGTLAFRAVELGAPGRMVGIDFSRTGLYLSRSISNQPVFRETDIELVQADLERIPLADRSVDVVISQATINLLPNKSLAMKEIARISKPGSKVAISDAFSTTKASGGGSWEQCIGGAVTVSEFSSLALDAGLIISNQVDLTQQVRTLVNAKKWDWPEFMQHNMDYRAFLMFRA
jgi:SAM-dependent methyltransferase